MEPLEDESGYWWLPQDPLRRYPGRLSFDEKDGARLELSIPIQEKAPSFTRANEEYPLIHGVTSQGREVSLLNCYATSDRWPTAEIFTQSIFGHFAFDGFHLPSVETANIKCISATVPFLSSWLGSTGIDVKRSNDLKDFDISYRQPPPFIAKITSSIQIKIFVRPAGIPISGWPGAEVKIREELWLVLEPVAPQTYLQLLDSIQVVFDFFTFVCMDLCAPEDIQLEGDFNPRTLTNGATIYPHASLKYMPIYSPKKKRSPHPMDLLLKSSDLAEQIEPVLSSWLEHSQDLKSVRVLYLSALYGEHPYIENKFLSICQAAEVFHRCFRQGEYMDSARYENEVLPRLISQIPTDLSSDLIEVMQQRFEYLNEFSLGKRLKELVAENKDIVLGLVPDIKDVLRAIVEARNQFTHFSGKPGRKDISGERILYYVYVLRMIVDLSVLRQVGVPYEILRKAAMQSELYRRMFRMKQQ